MNNSFKLGMAAGVALSALAALGVALGYRETVVKPEQEDQEQYDQVSKAAVRRSVAAHQSRF
ncbi:DUF3042 family protein [Leuconostocaceae bacterium ESL0723]|nr:DUF3042 family protein [Lactobacillaceae bacterium L1_55_11]WEV54151.1 DUF3042 family protein [Leuconostocaceae bacterium ESL0723]